MITTRAKRVGWKMASGAPTNTMTRADHELQRMAARCHGCDGCASWPPSLAWLVREKKLP